MISKKKESIGTIFLKEDKNTEVFISKMENLASKSTGQLKKDIETQVRFAKYGKYGEDNIAFELKNSGLDVYVLQDLYLQHNDLNSQIDYIVIARKMVYIIESKNLIGNIQVDKDGNFIRTYNLGSKTTTEGMYSPITQNERHRQLIKSRMLSKNGFIIRATINKFFDSWYKSIVVLANPKTILDDTKAPPAIQEQLVRADGLIRYIQECELVSKENVKDNKEMFDLAQRLLTWNNNDRKDYSLKYEVLVDEQLANKSTQFTEENTIDSYKKICPRCKSELTLRIAKRGDNKGNQFFGCMNYPKCRYIENM